MGDSGTSLRAVREAFIPLPLRPLKTCRLGCCWFELASAAPAPGGKAHTRLGPASGPFKEPALRRLAELRSHCPGHPIPRLCRASPGPVPAQSRSRGPRDLRAFAVRTLSPHHRRPCPVSERRPAGPRAESWRGGGGAALPARPQGPGLPGRAAPAPREHPQWAPLRSPVLTGISNLAAEEPVLLARTPGPSRIDVTELGKVGRALLTEISSGLREIPELQELGLH